MSTSSQILGPERQRDQGLGAAQAESGARAILSLLTNPVIGPQVDLIATYRHQTDDADGAYEVWSARGMVRFQRVIGADGGLDFEVLEIVGQNPIQDQDPDALRTLAAERHAAEASGFQADDPRRRFIAPEHQSHPFAYERIAQLFDSPHAPDLILSPCDWSFGLQKGQHGGLHVRQSRAPLWIAGRGVVPGIHDLAARAVDLAPTLLSALGFPAIDGRDATGRTSSERGVAPDVLLRRQDGEVLEVLLDRAPEPPRYLYIFLLDGLHPTELEDRLENDADALPNLRRLRERAAVLASGSIVNFPSITWPSHTTIGTGAWCGHHDVVNPSYYLREKRETISPQGQQLETEGFSSRDVESIYEAFRRVRGSDCLSAAIYAPFGRGADHAVLEGRNLCDRGHLRALNNELARDQDPRWHEEGCADAQRESTLDTRGVAQIIDLFRRDDVRSPDLVFHELILTDGVGHEYGPHSDGLRSALDESDRRIGRVLNLLDEEGRFEDTLFVVTADHGMAPQDTTLRANPARHVLEAGLSAVVHDNMIWLLDLQIEIERAPDGRTARVFVRDNDALPSGAHPPVEGARVDLFQHRDARTPERLARGRTGPGGVYGFSTPAEIPSSQLVLDISADGYNRRRLHLDGQSMVPDLRAILYGEQA
ncbi:MAG: alkaline phosphatase family protein [Deltaproteobacteria bacterium]|nr:alkaline phosphatase family protein [Deltaproteobacteria bacterium]MBW2697051.1 alkaline phosphatase family protein [Deltaproteobacteria bacterium]